MQVILPPIPEQIGVRFLTYDDTLIAVGYVRVVFGDRGPYVEFSTEQIVHEALTVPEDQRWRLTSNSPNFYYYEYRSCDSRNVKVYHQRKQVSYADYKIGMWYISPFELHAKSYGDLISWTDRRN